ACTWGREVDLRVVVHAVGVERVGGDVEVDVVVVAGGVRVEGQGVRHTGGVPGGHAVVEDDAGGAGHRGLGGAEVPGDVVARGPGEDLLLRGRRGGHEGETHQRAQEREEGAAEQRGTWWPVPRPGGQLLGHERDSTFRGFGRRAPGRRPAAAAP